MNDSATNGSSWPTVALGEIAEVKLGKMLDKSKHTTGKRLSYLRNINVRWGSVDTSDLLEMHFEDHELDRFGLRRGDVLVCEGGEPGRAAVWNNSIPEIKYQKAIHRIRFKQPYEPRLLVYLLELLAKTGHLERRFTGSTIKHFTREAIVQLPVPVPPLDEQQRIVAEIEKQFTRLDAGVASLKHVQSELKRYRASVLKAACDGRLVPTEAELARKENRSLPAPRSGIFYVYVVRCDNDSLYIGQTDNLQRRWNEHVTAQACDWTRQHRALYVAHYEEYSSREAAVEREKWLKTGFGRKWLKREIGAGRARQAGYETGEQLLQRILKERREKWKGIGKYKEPTAPNISNLPVLPQGWIWATAEQLGEIQLGRQRSPKNRSNKYPTKYLRAANITEEGIDLSDVLEMEFKPEEKTRYQLRSGDLILSEASGSPDQVGKPAICREEHSEYCFQNTVIRQRPAASSTDYLLVAYKNYYFNKVFARVAGGVGINHLSAAKFSKLIIPLPPELEQRRIVAEIERRLSMFEELEAVTSLELQRAVRLRQSILQRAFTTRLSYDV